VSATRGYLDATMSILRRDLHVYLSYRSRVVTQNAGIAFSLFLYYYMSRFVHIHSFGANTTYFDYVVIGIVVIVVLHSSFEIPNLLRQELLTGTFERLVVSPFGALGTTLALLLFPLAQSLFTASFTLLLAAALFGLPIKWATLPLAIPVALLGTLAFGGLSVALAAVMLRFKQVPGSAYILAAIGIVSGIYFPTSLLPGWVRWTTVVQPFTPAVDLLRHLVTGFALTEPATVELAKLVGFALIGLPLSIWILARSIRSARVRGTITEY
jgi:ABC-2 type transport system permease protein